MYLLCYYYCHYYRAVEDKNIGPLVKTIMTRCIHCTRCVRYSHYLIYTVPYLFSLSLSSGLVMR